MLREILLAGAVLTVLTAPSLAAGPSAPGSWPGSLLTGDMSIYAGGNWYAGSNSMSQFGESARFAIPLQDALHFEGELRNHTFEGEYSLFDALAHLYVQNAAYALGAFGGAGNIEGGFNTWAGGLEGQLYFNKLTLEGSIAYQSLYQNYLGYLSGEVGARYYLNPNTKLFVTGGFFNAEYNGNSTYSIWDVHGGVEHRFGNSPISIFTQAGWLTNQGYSETAVIGGIRLMLDGAGSTLAAHDKAVPWDTLELASTTFFY